MLASRSPRRSQILAQMGLVFTAVSPSTAINESDYIDPLNLEESLQNLAAAKAASVAELHPESIVLGADTIVVKDHRVFGKPEDSAEAAEMLTMLSGSKHQVLTGVALICREQSFLTTAIAGTDVFFRAITAKEIEEYLMFDEYRDKAGAYAIQGRAMIFTNGIKGCYYNVVGLPVSETIMLFKQFISSCGATDG